MLTPASVVAAGSSRWVTSGAQPPRSTRLGAYRASWLSWVNALIGVWIFVSAFWLDATGAAKTNDIVLGAIVFVLAIASATASDEGMAAERRDLPA